MKSTGTDETDMIKKFLYLTCITCTASAPVYAQEITNSPICFMLVNEAPYKVFGEISTATIKNENGENKRHLNSFRLESKGSPPNEKGHPTDRIEVCSNGPFFENRSLLLTLKSLFPIFSCKTNIEQGAIRIRGMLYDDGKSKTWAQCY